MRPADHAPGSAGSGAGDRSTADRRTGKRHATVLLIGRVRRAEGDAACLVHDISPRGLMARFTVEPRLGEVIRLEVRGLPDVAATVRWVRDRKAGVEFAARQDIGRVFCRRDERGLVMRSPRFALSGVVPMRIGDRSLAAELLDISPGGAKLRTDATVERGMAGRVTLPDAAGPLYGTVCWAADGRFGFRFATPLPLADLSRVLTR